jgi:archaellum component FlaC
VQNPLLEHIKGEQDNLLRDIAELKTGLANSIKKLTENFSGEEKAAKGVNNALSLWRPRQTLSVLGLDQSMTERTL